ncbi:hypothetical protein H0H93_000520 [Arthromyces matolae]|nr:hypothetical protein H0H93_000520 [Arthromyces matolae]
MASADPYFSHSRLLWNHPQPHATPIEVFRRTINRKHGLKLGASSFKAKCKHPTYSVEDYTFWLDLWESLGIISSVTPNPHQIIAPGKGLPEIPEWFPGARLNYAENLLWHNNDRIACTASGESGNVTDYTFRELRELVRKMAAALRVNGLQVGDRVAAIVTNSITAITIALATASIGGIYSSTATDMGTEGILDRYRQIRPKFVFTETEVAYSGKTVNLLPKVSAVIADLATHGLQQAILLPSAITGSEIYHDMSNATNLSRFLNTGDDRQLTFEQLPFNQPLFILYSSGTSGKPKCIVHSAGNYKGVLLQNQKDLRIAVGLTSDDTYFQYTTTGWMMWTYMLSGLACGARLILYDGSPFYPNVRTYLKFIHDQNVSFLGTSPRFLAEVSGQDINPLKIGSFEALRVICCTGAVLTPPLFEWTQKAFGAHRCKTLGMKVEVFDPSGKNIEDSGTPGELVCTRPHPSLPLHFWGDASGEKLRDAYFNVFPGVWRQGDFIVMNPATKGLMILGRRQSVSDGVLNPSGVRFGSGEIYSVLEKFSNNIEDSLCIGQRRTQDLDERVLLFLKMRPGSKLSSKLETDIKTEIRTALSARHVPKFIFEIEDIPYTVNGKKIEIAVKQIVSGSNLNPSGTVANPDSLKLYYKFRDLPFDDMKPKLYIAAVALLIWDHVVTFSAEVSKMWSQKFSGATVLYALLRYGTLFEKITILFLASCTHMLTSGPLRWIAEIIEVPTVRIAGIVADILSETIVIIVTVRKTFRLRNNVNLVAAKKPGLGRLLLRDGTVYFAALMVLSIADMLVLIFDHVPVPVIGYDYWVVPYYTPVYVAAAPDWFLLMLRSIYQDDSDEGEPPLGSLHFASRVVGPLGTTVTNEFDYNEDTDSTSTRSLAEDGNHGGITYSKEPFVAGMFFDDSNSSPSAEKGKEKSIDESSSEYPDLDERPTVPV